ncbi:hypothetical protein AJ78_01230 [Emergomyces pasteurianus Ep9510]|uniref:Uncharacterized protein n=1 Tax=Emergomyces pasteurianus Ep9510 TaxID=1447872 RepID=A0A1J9QRE9_9EURO|nr:hypothetical protein AJ78_01230 [Emergomyces pasteurianus Ep9510]
MPESRISSPNHASSQPGASATGSAPHPRHRHLNRAATTTFGEQSSNPPPGPGRLRRSSTFSDTVSEARNSIKSSTDDLFLPRVDSNTRSLDNDNESHWQSVPLALALLPAVGGLLFQNGSAVATDITLLVLAAVFLNWSIRLPWDWYHSAQEISRSLISEDEFDMDVIVEEPEKPVPEPDNDEADDPKPSSQKLPSTTTPATSPQSVATKAAIAELHRHELAALASCFLLPIVGAWLLHALRSQLSRPSEGLVSNYNLTVFLLAAEIRPFSHLLKMVQARTLYLQRLVSSNNNREHHHKIDASKIMDLSTRLEELEAHIAETVNQHQHQHQDQQSPHHNGATYENLTPTANTTKSSVQDQNTTQPDLSALTRAMRRYERRTALQTHETETRLQSLEKRLNDTISLNAAAAAAAQRSSTVPHSSPVFTSLNWMCCAVVLPAQVVWGLCCMPVRMAWWWASWALGWVGIGASNEGRGDGKDVAKGVGRRRSNGTGNGNGNGNSGGNSAKPGRPPISISRELMGSSTGGSGLQQRGLGAGRLSMSSLRSGDLN